MIKRGIVKATDITHARRPVESNTDTGAGMGSDSNMLVDNLHFMDRERIIEDQLFAISQIDANADENTPWELPARLLPFAELEYCASNNSIIKDPKHWCRSSTSKCSFVQLQITVYRRRLPDKLHDFDYHCCIDGLCKHVKAGHKCELPKGSCPHAYRYNDNNKKELKHVFACTTSGTLHACGENCHETSAERPKSGMRVCSLTGMLLGPVLVRDGEDWEYTGSKRTGDQLLLEDGGDANSDAGDEPPERINNPSTIASPQPPQAVPKQISPDKLPNARKRTGRDNGNNSTTHISDVTNLILRELIYSENRQRIELANVISDHANTINKMKCVVKKQLKRKHALTEIDSAIENNAGDDDTQCELMKHRHRCLPNTTELRGVDDVWPLTVWMNSYPNAPYFRHIPILPSMITPITETVRAMAANELFGAHDEMPSVRRQNELLENIKDTYIANERAMLDPKYADPECHFRQTTATVTVAVERVWRNIRNNTPAERKHHAFNDYIISLLYLMKVGLVLTCQFTHREVTLIPKVPFMMLLPIETTLDKFSGISQYVKQPKNIRKQRSEIMRIFTDIAQDRSLVDLEVKLEVCTQTQIHNQ
jgi:hypothetical protein